MSVTVDRPIALPDSRAVTRSGAVPWYLVAVTIASTSVIVGLIWDISWHRTIGRDAFLTPAHLAIYMGAVIAGLSNGYAHYLTTRYEYAAQQYEGASNIFGPWTLDQLKFLLVDIVLGAILTMVLLGMLDFFRGADAQAIVSAPRYHMQYLPDQVQFEKGAFDAEAQTALTGMGYKLDALDSSYGNTQAVLWRPAQGTLQAAADPRGVGTSRVVLKTAR